MHRDFEPTCQPRPARDAETRPVRSSRRLGRVLVPLAFVLAVPVAARAAPAPCAQVADQVLNGSTNRARLVAALAARFGAPVREDKLVITNVDQKLAGPGDFDVKMRVYYDGHLLANCQANKLNGALLFDIVVPTEAQGLKVYGFVLDEILARHPDIVSIPARMNYSNSDNAKALFDKAFGGAAPARAALADTAGPEGGPRRAAVRAALLAAFQEMPSTKARRRVGFRTLTKVIVDPKSLSVSFELSKGQPGDAAPRVILVRHPDGAPPFGVELGADGAETPVDAAALSLPDYDAMKRTKDYYK